MNTVSPMWHDSFLVPFYFGASVQAKQQREAIGVSTAKSQSKSNHEMCQYPALAPKYQYLDNPTAVADVRIHSYWLVSLHGSRQKWLQKVKNY